MEQAADSLRRLEAVVAGSATRGAAGENILARALAQLPPDLLEVNVAFGNKIVEYALRLPGGRLLPIDSKWTSAAGARSASTTPTSRPSGAGLGEQVARDLRARVREMAKYLDPERTLCAGAAGRARRGLRARRPRRTARATARASWSCRIRWRCPTCSRSTG